MAHYGIYLGGYVRACGVERHAPPERPQDRPRYGTIGRAVLSALDTPSTVGQLAARLHWDRDRTQSWVHHLARSGRVVRTGWTRSGKGKGRGGHKRAGVYQRCTQG